MLKSDLIRPEISQEILDNDCGEVFQGAGGVRNHVDEEMVVLRIGTIDFLKRMLNVCSRPPLRIE